MLRIEILAPAAAELADAESFYGQISEGLRNRFLDAVGAAFQRLLDFPDAAPLMDSDVRHEILHVFPYNIVYIQRPGKLIIVAIMHQKRKPGYWRQLLKDARP